MNFKKMARGFNVGDWIAFCVAVGLIAFVAWNSAGSLWNNIVGGINPPLSPNEITNLDLIAQRGMNLAAWWMVILTAITGTVGAISLWLIRENLLAAREVNRHAERSAKAAEAAVAAALHTAEITQYIGKAQTRCYLVVKSADCQLFSDSSFRLDYNFLNSGQTPARGVVVTTEVWMEFDIPGRGWVENPASHRNVRPRSDVPGQEARQGWTDGPPNAALTESALLDTTKYHWRVLVDITLICVDVFGEKSEETAYYGVWRTRGLALRQEDAQSYSSVISCDRQHPALRLMECEFGIGSSGDVRPDAKSIGSVSLEGFEIEPAQIEASALYGRLCLALGVPCPASEGAPRVTYLDQKRLGLGAQ